MEGDHSVAAVVPAADGDAGGVKEDEETVEGCETGSVS